MKKIEKQQIVQIKTLAAAALFLGSTMSASAQPLGDKIPTQASPALQQIQASCQAYEMRMRRTAMMNKVLSANYNAQRVIGECLANPELANR
jgi:hypothetical protein